MPKGDERNSRRRSREHRRSENETYGHVDPEYDARTYKYPDNSNHGSSNRSHTSGSFKPQNKLVDYDYASDDSPIPQPSTNKKKERKRSRSRSTTPPKREKKESKKSKKKKRSRSKSPARESSGSHKHKSRRRSLTPPVEEVQRLPSRPSGSPQKRRSSPPRSYARDPTHHRGPAASPPRAYQSDNRPRRDSRERERSPAYKRGLSPPASPSK